MPVRGTGSGHAQLMHKAAGSSLLALGSRASQYRAGIWGCWKENASSWDQALVCIADSQGCLREHANSRDPAPMRTADGQCCWKQYASSGEQDLVCTAIKEGAC